MFNTRSKQNMPGKLSFCVVLMSFFSIFQCSFPPNNKLFSTNCGTNLAQAREEVLMAKAQCEERQRVLDEMSRELQESSLKQIFSKERREGLLGLLFEVLFFFSFGFFSVRHLFAIRVLEPTCCKVVCSPLLFFKWVETFRNHHLDVDG